MGWGVCGKSLIFLEKIQKYLKDLGITSYIRKSDRPNNRYLYYVEVHKTLDVVKIANLMYKQAHIKLIRKYDKWHLFEETLKEKLSKVKEGEAYSNPESSCNRIINKQTGRFITEDAETIMRYLSST